MSDNIKKGGISVETHHIFPIIKKWLYSEKDIFLREIVSNATDAITKLKRLISLGEAAENEAPFRIDVICDKEAATRVYVPAGSESIELFSFTWAYVFDATSTFSSL